MITKQELENLNFPKIKDIVPILKNVKCKFYPTYLKVNDNVYLWCPKLNSEDDERGNNKWFNVISNDETEIREIFNFDDEDDYNNVKAASTVLKTRIVFGKYETENKMHVYRFKGVYELDLKATVSSNYRTLVWKKVSDIIDLKNTIFFNQ